MLHIITTILGVLSLSILPVYVCLVVYFYSNDYKEWVERNYKDADNTIDQSNMDIE